MTSKVEQFLVIHKAMTASTSVNLRGHLLRAAFNDLVKLAHTLEKERNELRVKNIAMVRLPSQQEMAELIVLRRQNAELKAKLQAATDQLYSRSPTEE